MSPPDSFGILEPFRQARIRLGLTPGADARAVKAAYRQAVAAHPPDRDPVAFQEIREAYELLTNPMDRATELLKRFVPHHPAPQLVLTEAPASAVVPLAEQILRTAVGALSSARAHAIAAAATSASAPTRETPTTRGSRT